MVLFRKKPKYGRIKVFGILCYASTLSHGRKKFVSRSKKCIFLGHPLGIKLYTLDDLDNHQVFVYGDVLLFESVFSIYINKCT